MKKLTKKEIQEKLLKREAEDRFKERCLKQCICPECGADITEEIIEDNCLYGSYLYKCKNCGFKIEEIV